MMEGTCHIGCGRKMQNKNEDKYSQRHTYTYIQKHVK